MAVANPMLYSLLCGLAFALAAAVLTWAVMVSS